MMTNPSSSTSNERDPLLISTISPDSSSTIKEERKSILPLFSLARYSSYACKDEHLHEAIHVIAVEFLNGFAAIFLSIILLLEPFKIDPNGYFFPAQGFKEFGGEGKDIPGVNFCDLLFPFFLFCMGISLSQRMRSNPGLIEYTISIAKDSSALFVLALFAGNFRIHFADLKGSESTSLGMSILAFVCIFFCVIRYPVPIGKYVSIVTRILGLGGIIAITASYRHYPREGFFSLTNSDPVLSPLASTYLFTSLWLIVSKTNIIYRVVPVGFMIALKIGLSSDYWSEWAWNEFPIPHLFPLQNLQWVVISIPATVIGDFFLENIDIIQNAAVPPIETYSIYRKSFSAVMMSITSVIVVTMLGVSPYFFGPKMTLIIGGVIIGLTVFIRQFLRYVETHSGEKLSVFKKSIYWGLYHIVLGWLMIPSERGIRANPVTLSYLFYSAGISISAFMVFYFLVVLFVFSVHNSYFKYISKFIIQFYTLCGYNSILMFTLSSWFLPSFLHLIRLGNSMGGYLAVAFFFLLSLTLSLSYFRVRWYGQYTAKNNIWVCQYQNSPFERMIAFMLNR